MTDIKRRTFLKGSLAAGAVGIAASAGLMVPQTGAAATPEAAFKEKELKNALNALYGTDTMAESGDIRIKAPELAENGMSVQIEIESSIPDTSEIDLFFLSNAIPLSERFHITPAVKGFVASRIKMAKTGDVLAVVKAGDKLYSAKKTVKVTIGGCGG